MKNRKLLKTNIWICTIIGIGFLAAAVLGYYSGYQQAVKNIEHVSRLTSEGIYYRLTNVFAKPVNVSLTMANDSLLKDYLTRETEHLEDERYLERIKEYLLTYREKYGYDSVFLVSAATQRYYNFNGLDRTLEEGEPENEWYFGMLHSDEEYWLNVDNDEVEGADNEITVFVDCKIHGGNGELLGIVGVGVKIDNIQKLLKGYEEEFGVKTALVSQSGNIEISTSHTGFEGVDYFEENQLKGIRDEILSETGTDEANYFWVQEERTLEERSFLVSRYIPELEWHLLVRQDTDTSVAQIHREIFQNLVVIIIIAILLMVLATFLVRDFQRQILRLRTEKEDYFREATEQLYDNIYELNITKNCAAGRSTERYFESLGVPPKLPFEQALHVIAEKQIKKEFREGYLNTFSPENILKEFSEGNCYLRYDFMIAGEKESYRWMRIDAFIYHCAEDDSVHMFTYRKDIDEEKRQELQIAVQAQMDEMTGLYTKTATSRLITRELQENPGRCYAFFIFDIDNFKQANDRFGHVFGDGVIVRFSEIIRESLTADSVIGRVGGDEFGALTPLSADNVLEETERILKKISAALDFTYVDGTAKWRVTASIGAAEVPYDGTAFEDIYKKADEALYRTKRNGKNGYTVYGKAAR